MRGVKMKCGTKRRGIDGKRNKGRKRRKIQRGEEKG